MQQQQQTAKATAEANGKSKRQKQKAKATVEAKGKSEIQGSLHCGGKSAAFGRDDVLFGWEKRTASAIARTTVTTRAKAKCRGSSLSASLRVRMTASVSKG
jgi:hypothetical protein